MKKYFFFKKLVAYYIVFAILCLLLRVFFIIYNFNYLLIENTTDWLVIFLVGLRFDLSTICLFMLPFSIVYFFNSHFQHKIIFYCNLLYLHISILFFIVINAIDTAYFQFNFRRSTIENLNMFLDIKQHFFSIISNFPIALFTTLILIVFYFVIIVFFKLNKPLENIYKISLKKLAFLFIFVGFHAVAIRGLNQFVLTTSSVSLYTNSNYGPIVCNTFQTFFYSLKNYSQKLYPQKRLPESEALKKIPIYHSIKNSASFEKKNVVIFILESFSRQYLETGNTNKVSSPFLDSLMSESLVCTNAFANGSISLNGIQNILSGIPAIEAASIIGSNYADNKIIGLPMILKNNGYSTLFFHGAEDDLFGFKRMTKKFGVENYFSEKNVSFKPEERATWGIHDEYFFDFSLSVLNKQHQPFFASIFNISSHDPYDIPEKYKNSLPKGKYKAQQSISYVDYCLQKFMNQAKKQPWFQNTLFVFVADHWNKTDEQNANVTGLERYKIPLFFYAPYNQNMKGKYDKVIDQNSIFPSILDLLNYSGSICSFGKSIKDTVDRKVCLMYQYPNVFEIINDKFALQYDQQTNEIIKIENYKNQNQIDSNDIKKTASDIQAFIQVYSNAVINNQLTFIQK